jgi:DMSO/TMAO reductase YedYZ molybdopterin-dependent catalytic subunit
VRAPIRTGAWLGLLLALPLTAVMDLAASATRVRFPPFDVFEWLTRILPGGVLAWGIETLVATLGALGLDLRTTSKTAEQALALALFVAGGGVLGLLLGAWFTLARPRNPVARSSLVAGAVGVVIALVVPSSTPSVRIGGAIAAVAWVVGTFLASGAVFGLAWSRLGGPMSAGEDAIETPVSRPTLGSPVVQRDEAATRQIDRSASVHATDRRRFLVRLGSAAAVVTVGGAGLAQVLRPDLADADAAAAPQGLPSRVGAIVPAPGTRAEITPVKDFYRIDIDLFPPSIDGDKWELPITGLVEKPARLTLDGFRKGTYGAAQHLFVTLECISNPIGGDLISTTRWTGVPLRTVLERLGPKPSARYAAIRSKDGFHESVSLDLAAGDPRVMLTYEWDGQPLPQAHGFPLRIYIPDRYGMKQPKWITSIEITDHELPGFWVERGWSRTAQVRTTSVIDTVAVHAAYEKSGKKFLPVGGIAYAGARGISHVQVKVDDGPWMDAAVGQPLSTLTWVLWRYDWPFESGSHTFTVRAVDGFGDPQIEQNQPPEPDGATGLYRVKKRV